MTYQNLIYDKKGRVAVVTLNRPEYLNGLAPGMGDDIGDVFREMDADEDVLCTVLTGAGRAFCSGHFMRESTFMAGGSGGVNASSNGTSADGSNGPRANPRVKFKVDGAWGHRAIDEYTKPLIAAVNGPAYGAGFNMALLSDIIIASTAARFCFPMSKIGIMPGVSGGPRLALRVGLSRALEMAIMARPIDGQQAYDWGLANRVVEPEQLMPEAMTWAEEIAGLAPISVKLAKEDIRESWLHHIHAEANNMRFRLATQTDDAKEGHQAWRDKRPPAFKGR